MSTTDLLQWPDYLVIALMLLMSAVVGFYYACTGGKQKTTREYIMADQSMHWLPVSTSLIASYISTLTMMGIPAEIYSYGTISGYKLLSFPIAGVFAHKVYLPVFKAARVTSIYEYTKLRFGNEIALVSMGIGVLQLLFRTTLVVYGPALALSQVAGINMWLSVVLIPCVAVVYTSLGCLKAVIWTDSIQLGFMAVGFLAVFIQGVVSAGGFSTVWKVSKQSGRLDFLDASKALNLDPRMRLTFWSQLCSASLIWTGFLATSQSTVQRTSSLKYNRQRSFAYSLAVVGLAAFTLVGVLMGLVIFTYYKYCDPISVGSITSRNQLYPFFVVELFGMYPGVSGFMIASMFSASLSTISTTLSSVSAITLQHIIRPFKPDMTEQKAALMSKITCLMFGCMTIGLVGLAHGLEKRILSVAIAYGGITTGPNLAVFALGMLNPYANKKGLLVGFFCAIGFGMWKVIGGLINMSRPYAYTYPVTTVGCSITGPMELSNLTLPTYDPSSWNPEGHYRSGVESLYDVSNVWNGFYTFILTFIISSVMSPIIDTKRSRKVTETSSEKINAR